MASLHVLQTRLEEAEEALHQINTGTREVSISYEGRHSVTYSQANAADLMAYIQKLKLDIKSASGSGRRSSFRVNL